MSYPGAKEDKESADFGCTTKSTNGNKGNNMPAVGDPKKLEILAAIQLAVLKSTGLNTVSIRGMGDKVEESLRFREELDLSSPVNRATCSSDSINLFVDESCVKYITCHPAMMYRKFKRV
jgi:hypothetical protein